MPDELTLSAGQPPEFTEHDFLDGTAPYEYLYRFKDNAFDHDRMLAKLAKQASALGIRSFKKFYDNYRKSVNQATAKMVGNVTEFTGQKLELNTGKWLAGDGGIYTLSSYGEQLACPHPIMPIERLVNIDSGTEKLKLAFKKSNRWREIIVEKSVLASPNSIIKISDLGVSVTSETAKALISYLQDVEMMNYEDIPEKYSVGRLGWIDDHGFSPYVEKLMFDGEANYRTFFESVRSAGSRSESMKVFSEIRHGSLTARIVLAASFASVLVDPCGCLPFFVHLWGSDSSGTGKTVALMVAASVWANPVVGHFIQTFNSTKVGQERIAAFFNSMPMMIDELQLAKDSKGKQHFDPYMLAAGTGKTRGTKLGGLEKTATWANCILTTGESPITSDNSGGGAVNRVIDIECPGGEPVISDGHRIASAVKLNYGHIGKEFIDRLDADGLREAQELYQENFRKLLLSDTTEKQAMAAALLLTADKLATDWIFLDDMELTEQEIKKFLATKSEVSLNGRAYDFICDWVTQNQSKLNPNNPNEVYGDLEFGVAFILPTILCRTLEDEGYSSKGFLSWLKKSDLLICDDGRMTTKRTISNRRVRCYAIKLPDSDGNPFDL